METDNAIYFYSHKNKYGYLSNFYSCVFEEDDVKFNCSEQYFMYRKCVLFDSKNTCLITSILNNADPKKIKACGRQVKNFNQCEWDDVKYEIMTDALDLKFSQNENLLKQLLDTYPKKLYEASPVDSIWGIGLSDKQAVNTDKSEYGQNLLGRALMKIRRRYK